MRVALVHDYLNQLGGAERVLTVLAEMFPDAPIYTLFAEQETTTKLPKSVTSRLKTSLIQKFPKFLRTSRILFPLYPTAIEQFNFSEFDVVISSSSAYAKNIITNPETKHICYCHSPMRYLWDSYHSYVKEQKLHVVNRCIVPFFFNKIRVWDFFGANRVDTFVANSNHVAQRIQKYYQRDAEVIYPPIPVKKGDLSFLKESKEDYFLIVSRLSAYKYIDQAIKVCNNLKINLKIIGTGREELRLKSMAGPTIEFLGRVSDKELANYYKKAKALLFLSEEDFGMTMVEALGWGTPVIALGKGGATEIILSQIHGMLYSQENEKGLSEAIMQFRQKSFDREKIYQHALQFDSEVFKKKITSLIAR